MARNDKKINQLTLNSEQLTSSTIIPIYGSGTFRTTLGDITSYVEGNITVTGGTSTPSTGNTFSVVYSDIYSGNTGNAVFYGDGSNLTGVVTGEYLPLSGGTLTGPLNTQVGNTITIGSDDVGGSLEISPEGGGEYIINAGGTSGNMRVSTISDFYLIGGFGTTGSTSVYLYPNTLNLDAGPNGALRLPTGSDPDSEVYTPQDGMIKYDNTDHEFRVRVNGTWDGLVTNNGITSYWSSAGTSISASTTDTVLTPKLETTDDGEGIIMSSPNGTRYKITVDNSGALVSTAI